MKVAISGGTGFVGSKLCDVLSKNGHQIYILTRSDEEKEPQENVTYVRWMDGAKPENELDGIDALVNLAGVSLNEGRWTEEQKKAIYESRMETTDEIFRILNELNDKPSVYVNASAVGIYPISRDRIYTEDDTDYATDFLGSVVTAWEEKASRVNELGIRTCLTRFGVILGKDSGALPMIVKPYQLGVGGTVGSGEQWLSWIHVEDVANAILFAIENDSLSGPINFTTPNAKRMKNFGKTIASALNRPHWLPVPSPILQVALGEKSILVLEGQNVFPQKLLDANYPFRFVSLEDAIIDLYK